MMPCLPQSSLVENNAKLKAIDTDVLYLGVCFGQVPLALHRCDINKQTHPHLNVPNPKLVAQLFTFGTTVILCYTRTCTSFVNLADTQMYTYTA